MTVFFLGVDGGGSNTRARLEDAKGNLLGVGLAGPSNLVRGIPAAKAAIMDATSAALQQASLSSSQLSSIHACIGVAGANVDSYASQLNAWQHPFHSLQVTTDLHVALVGSHGGGEGAVIITGTGFCGGISLNGDYCEVGGHGLLMGDGGSGALLGLRAVRHTLETLDGVVPTSDLAQAVCKKLGCNTAAEMVSASIEQPPVYFAALAPTVFEWAKLEDETALEIVHKAARFTANYARLLLNKRPQRFSVIGGIAESLLPYLPEDLQKQCAPALCTPVEGAVLLARRKHQSFAANM
ncbi:hypothetical protein DRW07_10855 [Alteromonas sediminis]|uniref:ATPase BadF/BadG/BcrA/BcrD type domain-containing protein n=1 Tax=Alteromonas sediminis TaxID=2259342 RepID=A0A3N5YBU2_9ALTE|nr:BadF/BadG/BcrA/BcrD ATPase family protein [Alteromonas sediminis]RPJ66575.1 hypothetical protein DRW07_10855 [Alteromonas sediminis]